MDDIDFLEPRRGFDFKLVSNEGTAFYCSSLYIIGGPFVVINSLLELDPKLDTLKLDISNEAMKLMLNWTCRGEKYDGSQYVRYLSTYGTSLLGNVGLRYDCEQLVKSCLTHLLRSIETDCPSELSINFFEKAGGDLSDLARGWLKSHKALSVKKQDVPERFWAECYKVILDRDNKIPPSNMLRLLFVQETDALQNEYIDTFFNELYRYSYVVDGASTLQALQMKQDHPVVRQFYDRAFPFIMSLMKYAA